MIDSKNKSRIVGLLILVSLFCVASVNTVGAQAQTPAQVSLQIYQVELDKLSEFRAAMKEWAALEKKAGTPFFNVSETAALGDTGKFVVVSPVANFADFGTASVTGPERDALVARFTKCVVSRQVMSVTPLADTKPLPPGQAPKLSVFQIINVAPGRAEDYVAWLRSEFFANFPEETHYVAGRIGLGGTSGFVRAIFFDDWDDLAKGPPVRRKVGAERAAAISAKQAGIATGAESMVLRYLPDISYDTRTP